VNAGRTPLFLPDLDDLEYLHCHCIVGTPGVGPVEFETGEYETALICTRGRAFLTTHDESYELGVCDVLYVPRRSDIRVDADGNGCELLEVSAPVNHDYPVRHTLFAEALSCANGADALLLEGGEESGRLSVGITRGAGLSDPPSGAERLQLPIDLPQELGVGDRGTLWVVASREERRAAGRVGPTLVDLE